MLVVPIPEREFNLYALALPEGPKFEPFVVVSGWKCDNSRSVGGVLLDHDTGDFAVRAFRRRIDHCFVVTSGRSGFASHDAALIELTAAMRPGEPPESLSPGLKKRPPLLDIGNRKPGENFKLLTQTPNHVPAVIANRNSNAIERLRQRHTHEQRVNYSEANLVSVSDERTVFSQHAKDLEALMSALAQEDKEQLYESLKKLGLLAGEKLNHQEAKVNSSRKQVRK
jgi:hypothetical protein